MFGKKKELVPQDPIAAGNAARLESMKEHISEMLERDDISAMAFVCITKSDSMVHGVILSAPEMAAHLLFEASRMITKSV